jgi:excinuclease ABC subunit C
MTDVLRAKLKTLPSSPGVYFHKNPSGEIIYIGKAAVLKSRIRQYFNNSTKDAKTQALVTEITGIDWIVVDTEMDALFLESEMIKRYMPKWNILMRDDKNVSYIRIDMKSEVPYLSFTRTPQDDGAEYYGPYFGKSPVATALRILRKIFPYYDKPYDGKRTLNTDLKLTPGIEIGTTTPAEYKRSLHHLIRYIKGDRQKLIKDLEKEMKAAAKTGDFEQAAARRNEYYGLKELSKKIVFSDKEFLDISSDQALSQLQKLLDLPAPPRRIEGYDISHQSGTNAVASMVVFTNGVSDRSEYRKFKIKESKNNDFANMQEVLSRRLKHAEWSHPDLVFIDGGYPQLRAVTSILSSAGIPYIGLAKELETIILPDGREVNINDNTHIIKLLQRIRDESHRFAITYHTLLKRKNMLK